MKEFKYISTLSEEDVENNIVIACTDEEGRRTIVIRNSAQKTTTTKMATDNLIIQGDAVLALNGKNFYCHIISAISNDYFSNEQFEVVYEYIFKKMTEPISSTALLSLINSLEELFKITPELSFKCFILTVII